jgi:proteasome lid subunit RPN8/RPN11
MSLPVSPCFRAFDATRALPIKVRGPVLLRALSRFASIWRSVLMSTPAGWKSCGLRNEGRGRWTGIACWEVRRPVGVYSFWEWCGTPLYLSAARQAQTLCFVEAGASFAWRFRVQRYSGRRSKECMAKNYLVDTRPLDKLMKRAISAARKGSREVTGLIVDNRCRLDLIECNNKSRRAASSAFYFSEVRRIVKAAKTLNYEVVGTFHSHPVWLAEPGDSDIIHAENDSLMLIVACSTRETKLWHIKNGKASEIKFKKSQ